MRPDLHNPNDQSRFDLVCLGSIRTAQDCHALAPVNGLPLRVCPF